MTDEPYVDPHHRLSDADFREVCARAKLIREEIRAAAQGGASSGIVPVNDMSGLGRASGKYFPVSGIPTQLLVVHSGECPLSGGYARSLTLWASTVYPLAPIASWQWFVDPLEIVAFIPPELGAWHASEANNLSEGFEQAGYARFTRAEWLTPDGRTQLESLAFYMAQRAVFNGIPARWLTDAEVTRATSGDRSIKGLCFHRQIDPETRTDPGNGYPADLLLERINFYMGGGTPAVAEPEEEPEKDDDMMYLTAPGDGRVWLSNGIQKWHVPDPAHVVHIKTLASFGAISVHQGGVLMNAPALGVDMGAYAPKEPTVALKAEDVATIAATLKASLAPELAAELARRLAA